MLYEFILFPLRDTCLVHLILCMCGAWST